MTLSSVVAFDRQGFIFSLKALMRGDDLVKPFPVVCAGKKDLKFFQSVEAFLKRFGSAISHFPVNKSVLMAIKSLEDPASLTFF